MRFLSFSFRQALEGLWRNRVMSLAALVTMVLMLVLLASLVIVLSGMQAGLRFVESRVEVRAELLDGVPADRVVSLRSRLEALPEVDSVSYLSKEQALSDFRAQRAEAGEQDLTYELDFNPFPARLSIKLTDPRRSSEVMALLGSEVGVVQRVVDQQKGIDQLTSVTAQLRIIGVALLALVALTVLLIVVNSIRMAMMSRAQEIEIMRLVGASDAFIRWPFVFEGALVGLLGALIALGLLAVAAEPLSQAMVGFFNVLPLRLGSVARDTALLVLGTGVGLGVIGSWLSVRTYLIR